MVINEDPVFTIDSTSLQYHTIFGTDFLDKCGFHLAYDQTLVHWMEYDIPLCNTSEFFS